MAFGAPFALLPALAGGALGGFGLSKLFGKKKDKGPGLSAQEAKQRRLAIAAGPDIERSRFLGTTLGPTGGA